MIDSRRQARIVVFAIVVSLSLLGSAGASAQYFALMPDDPVDGILDTSQRLFSFWLPAATPTTVTLTSSEFDPYLVILGPDGGIVGQNDDVDWGLDAEVSWTSREHGWYTAVVTSLAGVGRGEYRLSLSLGGSTPGGMFNASGWSEPFDAYAGELVFGLAVDGTLTENHLFDSIDGGVVYALSGDEGDAVSITLTSPDFDTYLHLLDPDGVEIAGNDDASDTFDSEIVARLPAPGRYTVVATSLFSTTGNFTLRADRLPELQIAESRLDESDAEMDGDSFHEYVWSARQGAEAQIWLLADFDAYLEVYDRTGALLASDDDSGGILDARLSLGPVDADDYWIHVTSVSGTETGEYTLYLWSTTNGHEPGSARPLIAAGGFDAALSAEGVPIPEPHPLIEGEMTPGHLLSLAQVEEYMVDLPPNGGVYDAWLFAEPDFELYGSLDGPIVVSLGVPLASEQAGGYEHLRIDVQAGTERLYLQVAPYADPAENGSFWVLLQEAVGDAEEAWPRREAIPEERARDPLAGAIQPGVRYAGWIDGRQFETQFWTVEVPEGVDRVHVGLFNADGDMDLSISPGWAPSSYGLMHDAFSVSVRQNERVSIGGPEDLISEVAPGLYTIAVWPGVPGATAYEILVTFDEPLPPSTRHVPLDPEEREQMNPVRRSQIATVQIENLAASGSGTILTADGLILTNYHVVAECKVSSSISMGCVDGVSLEDINLAEQIVALTDEVQGHAEQQFVAEVVRALPAYDLALLQIVADLDGNPVQELDLPTLPVDVRVAGAVLGDEVLALGYSDIARLGARTPISLTRGIVSGFTNQDGLRVFLQIDAGIAGGNSGGALVRLADGVLIGVPSDRVYSGAGVESQNFARPASLIPEAWIDLIVSRGGTVIE